MNTAVFRISRRLELYPITATPEEIGVLEGLRAATAVAAMVALAFWLDWPRLGWAAFGAFWVCLADPGGGHRSRLSCMGSFAVAGTLAVWIASVAAGVSPLLAGAVLLPLVFVSSLSGTYGTAAAQVGTLVSVVSVVAVEFPGRPATALELAGIFLLGCVWALILCTAIWRIHPHAPARRAIVSVFARLGDMTSELLDLDSHSGAARGTWKIFNSEHRRSVRAAIERARTVVTQLEVGSGWHRQEIDIADRVFAGLVAAGHDVGERGVPLDEATERPILHKLLLLLSEVKHQAGRRLPDFALLSTEAIALHKQAGDTNTLIGRAVASAAKALEDLADLWRNGERPYSGEIDPTGQRVTRHLKPIPTNVLRHAARTSIAVVFAYAIAVTLDLTFSYWATMATVVVLRPLNATTWPRTVERMVGSVAGGLLAAALMAILPAKLALLAMIFPIAAATIAFRFVNYALFVLFLTPLFVLVTELLQPGSGIALARAINNIIGSMVALSASFLFRPARTGGEIGNVLASAVTANLAYAAEVIAPSGSSPTLDEFRRQAGVASNAGESMRHRMLLEGQKKRAHLAEMAELLEALRVLAGAATAASLAVRVPDKGRAIAFGRVSEVLSNILRRRSPPGTPLPVAVDASLDDMGKAIVAVISATTAYARLLLPRDLARYEGCSTLDEAGSFLPATRLRCPPLRRSRRSFKGPP